MGRLLFFFLVGMDCEEAGALHYDDNATYTRVSGGSAYITGVTQRRCG